MINNLILVPHGSYPWQPGTLQLGVKDIENFIENISCLHQIMDNSLEWGGEPFFGDHPTWLDYCAELVKKLPNDPYANPIVPFQMAVRPGKGEPLI